MSLRHGNVDTANSVTSALGDKSERWNMPDGIAGGGLVRRQIYESSNIETSHSTRRL